MRAWIAVSLLLTACDLEPAGCDPATPDPQVPAQAIGPAAAEFFIPAASLAELGPAAARLLAQEAGGALCATLPPLQGTSGDLGYHIEAFNACRPLQSLSVTLQDSRLQVVAEYQATCISRTIELSPGDPVKTCELNLSLPSARLALALAPAAGEPRLELAGEALLETVGPTLSLSDRCPLSGFGALFDEVLGRLGPAQNEAAQQAAATLAATLQRAAGITAASAGTLTAPAGDGRLSFSMVPAADGLALDEAGLHLLFAGGFFGALSACVPATLSPWPPAASAPLWTFAPSEGTPFALAVSLDPALLAQALGEAVRAGLLCRPITGGMSLPLDDVLPSLFGQQADVTGMVALWPAGDVAAALQSPRPGAPVRFSVDFSNLHIDVYARLLGCAARVLGLEVDVSLALSLDLSSGAPRLAFADAGVTRLEIRHSALLEEGGGELRTQAAVIVRRLAERAVSSLGELPWAVPEIGRGGPRAAEVRQGRLVFFFDAYRP